MTQLEQLTLPVAVAPGRILLSKTQEQLFDVRVRGWPARIASLNEGPLTADQVGVPLEQGIRLEEEDHVVQAVATVASAR